MEPNRRPPSEPRAADVAARALEFARDHLGPVSERLLCERGVQALLISRVRGGARVEDAVLAEVHRAAAADRRLADEFLAYFLTDLLRVGRGLLSAGLRRFLDTGDLAQSILGDLWTQLADVRFETRAGFVSLLARRLRWKATDKARAAGRRPVEEVDDDAPVAGDTPPPPALAISREERERLILVLLRLPERDRRLLALHLRGATLETIGAETGLRPEAARKALQRALHKARKIAVADGARSPTRIDRPEDAR
ncbi:MAG: sigma-70 family RNA polymerase sigma factor [Planctomycetota bacterium JB042]